MVGNFRTRFSLPSFINRVNKLTNSQKNAITKMGFSNVLQIPNLMLSKNLLVELMERWSPEQRAFRLPPGNITISLMDVALILGLRVTGKPVILKKDTPFLELEREYGAYIWNRKITIASIEKRLESLGCIDDEDFMRSFLLFIFGVLLFPGTTGKVDSRYLYFLADLDKVGHYAWGAAVLGDVIKWLCKRKETRVTYIGGCLIFLQIWCYEHIDIARPGLLYCSLSVPRVCRWNKIKRANIRTLTREWFSTRFKELGNNQIMWELKPTSIEAEVDIVKELIEAQNDTREPYLLLSSSTSSIYHEEDDDVQARHHILEQRVIDLESTSDTREVAEAEEDDLMELTPPSNTSIRVTNNTSFPPKSLDVSKGRHFEQTNQLSIPEVTSKFVLISDDEKDHGTRKSDILQGEVIRLKKENDELKKENDELKMENDELRKENDILKDEVFSADSLVARLEELVYDENVSATEECSVGK